MRKETGRERAAWTEFITGEKPQNECRKSKFGNKKAEFNGRVYDSKREAKCAANLQILARAGKITELREQVSFTLVEGKGKVRPILYVADFVYRDQDGQQHVVDAKGFAKNRAYRMKKKMMLLLLGLEIEEV
jgi:hypothetical protein